jgi:hypothetical protein
MKIRPQDRSPGTDSEASTSTQLQLGKLLVTFNDPLAIVTGVMIQVDQKLTVNMCAGPTILVPRSVPGPLPSLPGPGAGPSGDGSESDLD